MEGAFVVSVKLGTVDWIGELFDVYANKIKNLAELSRFTLEGLVRIAFVTGSTDHIFGGCGCCLTLKSLVWEIRWIEYDLWIRTKILWQWPLWDWEQEGNTLQVGVMNQKWGKRGRHECSKERVGGQHIGSTC